MNIGADNGSQVAIRLASAEDAERIAALCQQLGYPSSREQVQRRLHQLEQDEDHAVYVAERPDGCVVGWVHVYIRKLVVADQYVEIGGLVVDEGYRGRGVGRLLMEWAERWSRGKGGQVVQIRSNVIRKEAHHFYKGIGYSNVKTQLTFRKDL